MPITTECWYEGGSVFAKLENDAGTHTVSLPDNDAGRVALFEVLRRRQFERGRVGEPANPTQHDITQQLIAAVSKKCDDERREKIAKAEALLGELGL